MSAAGEADEVVKADVGPELKASADGVLCDARSATVTLYDDGLLRGDGAFEFVRCYAGRPFTLVDHLDRMAKTCAMTRAPWSSGSTPSGRRPTSPSSPTRRDTC